MPSIVGTVFSPHPSIWTTVLHFGYPEQPRNLPYALLRSIIGLPHLGHFWSLTDGFRLLFRGDG